MSTLHRRRNVAESSDDEDGDPAPRFHSRTGGGLTPSTSATNVAVAESRFRKIIIRSLVGIVMVNSFLLIVWAGHLYLIALVVLIQVNRWYHLSK